MSDIKTARLEETPFWSFAQTAVMEFSLSDDGARVLPHLSDAVVFRGQLIQVDGGETLVSGTGVIKCDRQHYAPITE